MPNIAEPTEDEAAPRAALAETRHKAEATDHTNGDQTNGVETDDRIFPLLFGIFCPVSEDVFDLGWCPRILGVTGNNFLNLFEEKEMNLEWWNCLRDLESCRQFEGESAEGEKQSRRAEREDRQYLFSRRRDPFGFS